MKFYKICSNPSYELSVMSLKSATNKMVVIGSTIKIIIKIIATIKLATKKWVAMNGGCVIGIHPVYVSGCMSAAEISKQLNLQSMRNHQWHIQACCALSGEGLYQGLEWIVSNINGKR